MVPKQTERPINGFSVMEILVAASILGVVLVSIWSIFIFSTTQIAVARARTVANNIAKYNVMKANYGAIMKTLQGQLNTLVSNEYNCP